MTNPQSISWRSVAFGVFVTLALLNWLLYFHICADYSGRDPVGARIEHGAFYLTNRANLVEVPPTIWWSSVIWGAVSFTLCYASALVILTHALPVRRDGPVGHTNWGFIARCALYVVSTAGYLLFMWHILQGAVMYFLAG